MDDLKIKTPSVIVSGGTGFVGVHLVQELLNQGIRTKCLVRNESNQRDVVLLEGMGANIIRVNDFNSVHELSKAMRGSNILVHLIGSIAPKRGVRLEQLQTETARRFFSAARNAGVKKVLLLTALGCGPEAQSEYYRTKWLAEEALKDSGMAYVIFRPSLIVGRELGYRDSKIVRRYVDLIQKKQSVPLILGGNNRIQPIFVGDLVEAMGKTLRSNIWDNKTLELGGSEILTTRQFLERLMNALRIHKNFTPVPGPLAWIAAIFFERFQEVPTLSRDQLKIASTDSVAARNSLIEDFKIVPHPLNGALACYANHQTTN